MTKKTEGYEITEKDIETTIKYLKTNGKPDATRENAIEFLEGMQATMHVAAHKIVEDIKSGKLKPIKKKKSN